MQDVVTENVSEFRNTLSQQVAADLSKILATSKNPKSLLKKISTKINVHEKTLERVLQQLNKPTYATVFKIYRYILNEVEDSKVIENTPDVVKEYLQNANPQQLERGVQYLSSIDDEIQKNPIFAELYILAGSGPLKENDVVTRFGQYGVQVLESMLQRMIIIERKPSEYVLGPMQTNISPDSILRLGIQLTQNYARSDKMHERTHNYVGFLAEGLSEEAYQRWIRIDEQAYQQKLEISRDPNSLGSKKAFTFNIIETLDLKGT